MKRSLMHSKDPKNKVVKGKTVLAEAAEDTAAVVTVTTETVAAATAVEADVTAVTADTEATEGKLPSSLFIVFLSYPK